MHLHSNQSRSSPTIEICNVPVEAVGLAELAPVPVAAAEAPAEEAGAAPPPGIMAPVWEEGKRLAIQLWTQSEYFSVASLVPSPWSHLAAHSVVSTAWEELGRAMPKHAAWQLLRLCERARQKVMQLILTHRQDRKPGHS